MGACAIPEARTAVAPVAVAPTGGAAHPFGAYWNSRIPATPRLDPGGAAMVRYLAGTKQGIVADLYAYGVPIYSTTSTTPLQRVTCTMPWGPCDLERARVPIPANARPNSGSDAAMVVVDPAARRSYEFWQARRVDTGWRTSWGEIVALDGKGTGGATGSGISRLAGVVRASEIARREIPHALVFSTDNACTKSFRTPATKTDGVSTRADCVPEGARLQLSPSINVDRIPGITPAERAVAQALQTYGAYAIDVGGARAAFIFEKPPSSFDPYPAAGLPWDYYHMPHIPWQQLRVLAAWDGS